jgi:hypothetical protein
MKQLLVNTPKGFQDIVHVDATGGYFDTNRVVWNEWLDGELPSSVVVGGMKRVGNSLEFDQQLLDAHNAALATQVVPAPTKEQLLAELQTLTAKINALE